MNNKRLALPIAGIACALSLGGCVTTGEGRVAAQPVRTTAVVAAPMRPGPPVAPPQPVVREELMPERNDVYVATATDRDVVYLGGDTYIWVTDAGGRRRRQFYAHGDRRREVFHRRDNLRSAMVSPREVHPVVRHAGDDHHREEPHHREPMRAAATDEHRHEPGRHMAANERGHHPDTPHQSAQRPNHPVREAAAENPGAAHRPAPGGQPVVKTVSKS
ncbi:hypothetical protein P3T23_000448 [Paraburkholderia sp. GAS448]|uniref:hypothetical protein n=1 Tax=Paraburkholderia sp. GAS448 TaxID=3035136 RepID=UPI003D1FE38F